jgi:hypothetical protein
MTSREEGALMLAITLIFVGIITFIVSFAMSLDERRGVGCLVTMVAGAGMVAIGSVLSLAP